MFDINSPELKRIIVTYTRFINNNVNPTFDGFCQLHLPRYFRDKFSDEARCKDVFNTLIQLQRLSNSLIQQKEQVEREITAFPNNQQNIEQQVQQITDNQIQNINQLLAQQPNVQLTPQQIQGQTRELILQLTQQLGQILNKQQIQNLSGQIVRQITQQQNQQQIQNLTPQQIQKITRQLTQQLSQEKKEVERKIEALKLPFEDLNKKVGDLVNAPAQDPNIEDKEKKLFYEAVALASVLKNIGYNDSRHLKSKYGNDEDTYNGIMAKRIKIKKTLSEEWSLKKWYDGGDWHAEAKAIVDDYNNNKAPGDNKIVVLAPDRCVSDNFAEEIISMEKGTHPSVANLNVTNEYLGANDPNFDFEPNTTYCFLHNSLGNHWTQYFIETDGNGKIIKIACFAPFGKDSGYEDHEREILRKLKRSFEDFNGDGKDINTVFYERNLQQDSYSCGPNCAKSVRHVARKKGKAFEEITKINERNAKEIKESKNISSSNVFRVSGNEINSNMQFLRSEDEEKFKKAMRLIQQVLKKINLNNLVTGKSSAEDRKKVFKFLLSVAQIKDPAQKRKYIRILMRSYGKYFYRKSEDQVKGESRTDYIIRCAEAAKHLRKFDPVFCAKERKRKEKLLKKLKKLKKPLRRILGTERRVQRLEEQLRYEEKNEKKRPSYLVIKKKGEEDYLKLPKSTIIKGIFGKKIVIDIHMPLELFKSTQGKKRILRVDLYPKGTLLEIPIIDGKLDLNHEDVRVVKYNARADKEEDKYKEVDNIGKNSQIGQYIRHTKIHFNGKPILNDTDSVFHKVYRAKKERQKNKLKNIKMKTGKSPKGLPNILASKRKKIQVKI